MNELEKIDAIRERMGVSYSRAKEAIDAAGGDLVGALMYLEKDDKIKRERFQVRGSDLVEKVKQLLREGTVRRIVVRTEDRTIFEIPVAVGALGAILLPTLAALGVVAAMVTQASIIVERRADPLADDDVVGNGDDAGIE